jgi:hypothetical protein
MSLHPNQKKTVGAKSQYRLPSVTSITSRTTTKILPSNGTSFGSGQQITIELPATSFLDCQNSYLSCVTTLANATSSSNQMMDDNSAAFIDRLRISDGRNQVLIDIQNYNILNGVIETVFASKDYRENAGQVLEGIGGGDTLRQAQASSGQRRCLSLIGGVLDNASYFPLQYTNGLIVDIFISSAAVCSSAAAGTNTLTVSDVAFVTEVVQMDAAYTAGFEQAFLSGGIKYHLPTYISSSTSLTSNNENKQITENLRSLKTIWAVMKTDATDINTVTTNTGTETFRQKGLQEYQFRWGNQYIPSQAIKCTDGGAEAMKELIKGANLSSDVSFNGIINSSNYTTDYSGTGTSFIIAQNVELDPHSAQSGIDSNKKSLSVALTFSTTDATRPSAAQGTLYTFAEFDQIIVFSPSGSQVIY